jgi:hypothetical protein
MGLLPVVNGLQSSCGSVTGKFARLATSEVLNGWRILREEAHAQIPMNPNCA